MPRYQLLLVDVDGTLAGHGGLVSPRTARALAAAEAAGVRVGLCTGRTEAACADYLTTLGLSGPHTFFDGSLVVDPRTGQTVLAHAVDQAATEQAIQFARQAGLTLELYTRTGYFVAEVTPEVAAHAALQGHQPAVGDLAAVLAQGQVIKAEFVLSGQAGADAVRQLALDLAGKLRFSWATAPGLPHLHFVNVVHPAASKGAALAASAAHLNLALHDTAAAGDGANDLPLLQQAGLAIAMGNAPEALRAVAHLVTGTVEEDGLAQAVERCLLAN